jgi:membrane protease YdiL (CAAX protease family)
VGLGRAGAPSLRLYHASLSVGRLAALLRPSDPKAGSLGFWATLGWGLLAWVVAFAGAVTANQYWPFPRNAFSDQIINLAAEIALLAVLIVAVKIRRYSLRDYFAIERFSIRDFALGVVCLVVIFFVFVVLPLQLGIDIKANSLKPDYQTAQLSGSLPLLWLTTVVLAPVSEELVFRGFLYRGWSASRIGSIGTIALTSGLWAMLHQYDWIGTLAIFSTGLTLGWLRQRSGSTTLTIVLHAFDNLIPIAAITLS